MANNHTKGPWYRVKLSAYDWENFEIKARNGENNVWIAHVHHPEWIDEAPVDADEVEANALLISKAPDMLDILKACLPWLAKGIEQGINEGSILPNSLPRAYDDALDVIKEIEKHGEKDAI